MNEGKMSNSDHDVWDLRVVFYDLVSSAGLTATDIKMIIK